MMWLENRKKLENLLIKLINSEEISLKNLSSSEIPKEAGVYLILNKKEIIYIGKSDNLRRRIISNHLKGDVIASILRKKIKRIYLLKDEKDISQWIKNNCSVKFMRLKGRDISLLEHFAIAVLNPILND